MFGPIASVVSSKMMNVEIKNFLNEVFASELPNPYLANLVNFFQSSLHGIFCTKFADFPSHWIPLLIMEQYGQRAGIRHFHILHIASYPALLLSI
jgi:hypothetical protein